MGLLVRPQLQHGLVEFVAVAGAAERRGVGDQPHDHVEALRHDRTQVVGSEAEHERVGEVPAGAHTEVDAPPGEVVEQHDAVGGGEGVVVRQAHHAGAEADVPGAFGGDGEEQFGGGDELPPGAVMLADPRLVEAERIGVLDQLQVPLEREGRVLAGLVEGRQEHAEGHPGHPRQSM